MSAPFFSVVIPVYNREKLVQRAIESVLAQEQEDYELIVVDDGSTDGTREAVRSYGEKVRLFEQENAGPGVARNRGIQEARGEYVTFLDSDDQWLPWTLATFDRAIHQHDRPAFVVGTHVGLELEDSTEEVERTAYRDRRWPDYYAAVSDEFIWVRPPSVAIRKDVLHEVGGFSPKRMINGEDTDLWLKLGVAPGFVHIRQPPVSTYHRHEEGIVNDPRRTYRTMRLLLERENEGEYPGESHRRDERVTALMRRTRPASLGLLRAHHFRAAAEIYAETASWNLELSRWRYIAGFPFLAIMERLGLYGEE
jgi:glycosyltransferase involved in cell wall biosynthesis